MGVLARCSYWHTNDAVTDLLCAKLVKLCFRALVAPVVKGTEHLPDPLGPRRPILFVGEPLFTLLMHCQISQIDNIDAGPVHLPIIVYSLCTPNSHLQWTGAMLLHMFI